MTLYFCPRCDEGVWYGIPHRCLPPALASGTAGTTYAGGYSQYSSPQHVTFIASSCRNCGDPFRRPVPYVQGRKYYCPQCAAAVIRALETPAASASGAAPHPSGTVAGGPSKVAPDEGTDTAAAAVGTDDSTATTEGGVERSEPRPPVAPDQALINAATVIGRLAGRPNRHPETRRILMRISTELRDAAFGDRFERCPRCGDPSEIPNPSGRRRWTADVCSKCEAEMDAETCHCGEPVAYGFDGDPAHHRGMCSHCDAVRCDAHPGECER